MAILLLTGLFAELIHPCPLKVPTSFRVKANRHGDY